MPSFMTSRSRKALARRSRSGGQAAPFEHVVPQLLRGACFQTVQLRARVAKRMVTMPRFPGLTTLPGPDDDTIVRLITRPEQLPRHPAVTPLRSAQALVHRAISLALASGLQLDAGHDRHHGYAPPREWSPSKRRTGDFLPRRRPLGVWASVADRARK